MNKKNFKKIYLLEEGKTILEKIKSTNLNVVWSCDPMHANIEKSKSGFKTRNFKNILSNIRKDILAGITVGIIALPLALAFGEMSLLGPEAGIWGAIIGGVIGGIFGGCIISVSGPTAPTASQIADVLRAVSPQFEPGVRKCFISAPSESWSPKEGTYSFNVSWTYELDK